MTKIKIEQQEEKKKPKIAIASHAFRMVDYEVYFNHVWCIGHWSLLYELVLIGKRGLSAATARNKIFDCAIEEGATHIFIMDADHIFPKEALPMLMESADEAIVSGLVCKKGEGFQQVAWLTVDPTEDEPNRYYKDITIPLDGKLYDVGVCAFGCTLINIEKLKKLEKPYFRDTYDPKTEANIRSDINLCNMFRDAGEKVWIDTRVLVGHYGMETAVFPQNAVEFANLKNLEQRSMSLDEDQKGVYYVPQP